MNLAIWLTVLVFGAHPELKKPACNSWPPGLVWAGAVNYDVHGCAYPSLSGECTITEKARPAGCFEYKPPKLVFKHEVSTKSGTE